MQESIDNISLSQKTKEYARNTLTPVLEDLVTSVLRDLPENPAQYMLNHLRRVSGVEDELLAEVKSLRSTVETAAAAVVVHAPAVADPVVSETDAVDPEPADDDEDGGVEDSLVEVYQSSNRGRQAVSAEAFGEWNKKPDVVLPVYEKSPEQKRKIAELLTRSFLFNTLDVKDVDVVVDAMEQVPVEPETEVIKEGDMGDFLFIIESGTLNCFRKNSADDAIQLLKVCESGDVFGELSLLYNAPRAASVSAVSSCVLWKLDRSTFTHIARDGASRKRERYEAFLKSVPLLSRMGQYEISQVADALTPKDFGPSDLIVEEGAQGDVFYILESGSADAFKGETKVLNYSRPGEYFGELALIRDVPRAASVKAGAEGCRCLMLDRRSFTRLLGSLEELVGRTYEDIVLDQ